MPAEKVRKKSAILPGTGVRFNKNCWRLTTYENRIGTRSQSKNIIGNFTIKNRLTSVLQHDPLSDGGLAQQQQSQHLHQPRGVVEIEMNNKVEVLGGS